MAEPSKVRLVRCPKCENLLPELPDFSLYKCGGCGAVLKAKKKGIVEDRLSNISEGVKGGGISKENSTVKGTNVEMDSADGIEDGGVEQIQKEGLVSNDSSTLPAEFKEVQTDSEISRRGKERVRSLDSSDDEFRPYPQGLTRNRNRGKSCDFNVDGPEFVNFHDENVKGMPPMDSSRSRPVMDQWGVKSKGSVHGPGMGVSAQVRSDDFLYHDEGQSSYGMNSYYEQQGERTRYRGHNLDGLDRIDNLENGRAELLRKLDELKDRIARSCDMAGKPKEKIGIDQRKVSLTSPDPYDRHHAAYAQEGLTTSSQAANRQPVYPDNVMPPYFGHSSGFVPYSDRYGSRVLDPYTQRGYPHEYVHYANAYKPEVLRKPPHQLQSQYIQQPYHERYPGYYGDVNHDRFMLHRHENFFHQPACSCVHCCDNNWHMPPRVDPPGLHNRRSQNEPSNLTFDHLNPVLHRQHVNGSGGSNLYPPQSRQSLTLNSNDIDSENDGFNYHRPRKLVVAPRSGRMSHPIGGGAPFITCSNCFELLKLSRKHISVDKNQQKLKCGACSSVILFELGDKGFVASVSTLVEELPTEIDEVSGGIVDNVRYWNDGSSTANMNTCSNDFDDFDPKFSPADKKSNSGIPEKQLSNLSSTLSPSEDEQSPENKSSGKHDSPIPELPVSPQELPDHSPENLIVSRYDKWNKSRRPEQEKVSLDRTTSKQNSVRDGAMATDTDVSLTAFSNSNRSQDFSDTSREVPKVNKGGESFFAGLIKKSFRDFKKSNQGVEVGRPQVFVNGHLIPDRVVKKAEKLAGPIQPGEYWYDKQAGFWGVIGYPCLGIIMPNIEEFNYPIPKNCAAGNTGVYVNGRELNEKDLDLLAGRGLPITENRSYLVDITGKVIDEQTKEELDGLGKLAPTVERAKHGFGMKVPRFIAQSKG
ncbi:hypothetical protein C2S53_018577 [Perilla frutescens var. hirtella]|uniref:Zinc-ribbon domain-containing protein n=1 Tax=Perilla frutescens var. hirtella TaxID=608512 RepID=A0AAD4IM06_PERFH|nr:hypothetical protein C2S53_018577 [Perilla frutescens var. hirtella]